MNFQKGPQGDSPDAKVQAAVQTLKEVSASFFFSKAREYVHQLFQWKYYVGRKTRNGGENERRKIYLKRKEHLVRKEENQNKEVFLASYFSYLCLSWNLFQCSMDGSFHGFKNCMSFLKISDYEFDITCTIFTLILNSVIIWLCHLSLLLCIPL